MRQKPEKVKCETCGKEWWVSGNKSIVSALERHKERGCKGAVDNTPPILMPTWATSPINSGKPTPVTAGEVWDNDRRDAEDTEKVPG